MKHGSFKGIGSCRTHFILACERTEMGDDVLHDRGVHFLLLNVLLVLLHKL